MKQFSKIVPLILFFCVYGAQEQQGSATQAWNISTTKNQPRQQSSQGSTSSWAINFPDQTKQTTTTSSWNISSKTQSASTHQTKGLQVDNVSNQSQAPRTQAWNITSSAQLETTIYSTNAYSQVSSQLYMIQETISKIIDFYTQANMTQQTEWKINSTKSAVSSSANKLSPEQAEKYQKSFTNYLAAVAGKQNSYLSCINGIFQAYRELPRLYAQRLQQERERPEAGAQTYFAKMPFQESSFALELVQEATGSILNYIRTRIELISDNNYQSEITQQFLVGTPSTPSQFAQLHRAVDMFEGVCESYFKALEGTPGISRQDFVAMQNNYKKIFTSYEQESSKLLIAFTLKLLKNVATQYPVDLAMHANVMSMDVNLPVLKELYALSKSGLDVVQQNSNQQQMKEKEAQEEGKGPQKTEQEQSQTFFGMYKTPDAVLQVLAEHMGDILAYAGTVEQNLINQQIQQKNLDSNIPEIQKAVSKASLLFMQAAGCYLDAKDTPRYTAYGTFGKALSMVAQAWIKAQRNDKPGTYGYAAEQYQVAYEAAQQSGSTDLSFLLLRFYNMAMLDYAQYSLAQYAHFGQYQNDIVSYIQNAATVPESKNDSRQSLVQNLFYSQGSTAFKGIATLCAQVAESYKASLSSLQATKSSMNSNKKLLLQNGITVTQNIAQAAQAMLVGVPKTEDEPAQPAADTSMYVDYYNPESVFYGQQRYLSVFHSFQTADTALEKAPRNPYSPLLELFAQSPIKTFTGFAQIHFARICLMSALEAQAYIDDPQYAYYKTPCTISSFLSLLSAYKVYKALNCYPQLVEYCTRQLQNYKESLRVILQDAQTRIQNTKATQLDYQMALAETQGAALLGDQQAVELYEQVVQKYVEKAQLFAPDFPASLQAYTYYQAYLLMMHIRSQEGVQKYEQLMGQSINQLLAQIKKVQQFVLNTQEPFEKRIEVQKQLQDLQKALEQYAVTQYYDQALFGVEKNDFCSVQKAKSSTVNVPQIVWSFSNNIQLTMLNPLYQLARLYVESSDTQLQAYEQNFNSASPNYNLLTTPRFKQLMKNYKTALMSFGQLGLQNAVMQVEQSMTRAAAFRYFSAVIPSDVVKEKISISRTAIVNTNKQPFQSSGKQNSTSSWTISAPTQSQAPATSSWSINSGSTTQRQPTTNRWSITTHQEPFTTQRDPQQSEEEAQKPSLLPDYLVAGWQVNISKLAESASTIAAQAQNQASEGGSIPQSMAQKQKLYTQILATAQKLMGKKESMADIIKYIALPLFQDQLESGGYQGVFRSLEQEVELYYHQLLFLATQGMQIGDSTLKATLQITTQQDATTGKEDIVLEGTNLPLAAIPRYRGDTNCAVFYYSLYKRFFNQTGQPVDVSGQIFFPVTGEQAMTSGERGEREIDRAYLASSLQYQQKIAYLVQPFKSLSSEQRFNLDFQKYATSYKQLGKAYQWQVALISAIQMLQKKAGLGYVNVNQKMSGLYQEWAEDATLFLFGAPFDASYISVLNSIQGYYDLAAQSNTNPAMQGEFYRQAAQLNINAAEYCAKSEQIVPQVNGYPSTKPTGYPSGSTTVGASANQTLKCGAPPSYSMPASDPIVWKRYEDAQMHYSQALKLYKQALTVEKKGSYLSDPIGRSLAGLSYMCHVRAMLQRVALFTRNAWTVQIEQKDHVTGDIVNPNVYFKEIAADGASGGATAALKGAQSLVSGTGKQSSGSAVAQYQLMKKIILDANLYAMALSGVVTGILNEMSTLSKAETTQVNAVTGSAIICGAANNIPNLGVVLLSKKGTKKGDGPAQVNITTYDSADAVGYVNLNTLLTETSKITLPYADTFPSFVEYVTNDLVGSASNDFERLDSLVQVSALNSFTSQITQLLANLYKQTFLPTLMKDQTNTAAIEKAETSFQTAIKAASEKLLVNATGYLG